MRYQEDKNTPPMYGYIDESGTPGLSQYAGDTLVVSIVLFKNHADAKTCSEAINRLRTRLGLDEAYEFHYSRNANKPQQAMIKLLPDLDFCFISIAIYKDDSRSHASYKRVSELLVKELSARASRSHIEMDSNPKLYSKLRAEIKKNGLKCIRLKQVKSRGNNLIQVADYVAAMSSKKIKGATEAIKQFRPLIKKQSAFIEVA